MTRRVALEPRQAAWIVGDRKGSGFIQFQAIEQLQSLWDAYGDHDAFIWKSGMRFPEPTTAN